MAEPVLEVRIESKVIACEGWAVRRLRGREAIGQLFEFDVTVVETGEAEHDFAAVECAPVTLSFERKGQPSHRIHGIVAGFSRLDPGAQQGKIYALRVVPAMWLSTLVRSCDFYVGQSIVEVILDKLAPIELTEDNGVELRLGEYPPRRLVVQYQESDRDFIARLCEHEGVSFFFEHGADESLLVLSDHHAGFRDAPTHAEIDYAAGGDKASIQRIDVEHRSIPQKYICRDYDDERPRVIESLHALAPEQSPGGAFIEYGTNPDWATEGALDAYAQRRAEEHLARRTVYRGVSHCPHLTPGTVFQLRNHPFIEEELLITEVEHELEQPLGGQTGEGKFSYENRFAAVPAANTYRPPRRTPKPRIQGVVPGIVEIGLGEVEKEAKLDDAGRYHVRLLFGNEPPAGGPYSQRVRQIQMSAGPRYGVHFPLKPGVEVAVAFVDGDPDRPIIVGAVPNPLTASPVNDANATHSRMKTESGILIELGDTL